MVASVLVIAFWVTAVMVRRLRAPAKPTAWIDDPWVDANGWSVGHFVHYALLGFIKPQWWPHFVAWSVVFEVLEAFLANLRMQGWSEFVKAAVVKDSVINTLGVLTGIGLRFALPVVVQQRRVLRNIGQLSVTGSPQVPPQRYLCLKRG
jgi:hypothetical protein